MGMVLLIVGATGSIACIVLLCVMERNWKKQRRRLLEKIEAEE